VRERSGGSPSYSRTILRSSTFQSMSLMRSPRGLGGGEAGGGARAHEPSPKRVAFSVIYDRTTPTLYWCVRFGSFLPEKFFVSWQFISCRARIGCRPDP